MEKIEIDGQTLKSLLEYGYKSLLKNKQIINDLNVFPIPDGDTGDNMCMTFLGGLASVKDKEISSVSLVAKTCSDGMLNSARGNSGVILSQLFDGFAKGLEDKETIVLKDLVGAFESATKQGYLAVDKPTEGTMLTVARETTENLKTIDFDKINVYQFLNTLLYFVKTSVDETPEKLDKLKENGVVDSGGAGLYFIVEGFNKYIHGEKLDEEPIFQENKQEIDYSKFNENTKLEFGYCSEVLLQLTKYKTDIDAFDVNEMRDYLDTIGDSLVIVKNGYVIKIHVHTFEPYKLLEYCSGYGEFLKIKIENMMLQHNEANIQNNFAPKLQPKKERKKYGVVAVASGSGLKQTFKDFGADVVIDGGQTNNPSIGDFISAFNEVNSDIIFVFPNNGNVILSAKQAQKNYKASKVHVIETKDIGEGYSALSMLDFSSDNEESIIDSLYGEIKNTTTGAITTATRDTVCNDIPIKKDDYIGLIGKNIVISNAVRVRSVCGLLDKMPLGEKDFAVLIYGKDISQKEKDVISEYVSAKHSNLEIYEIDGGQDIYDFYIVLN